MAHAADPESFARAHDALGGARFAFDRGASAVMRFMLDDRAGCDAVISAAGFEVRFGSGTASSPRASGTRRGS